MKMNEKLWGVLKYLDDISLSTLQVCTVLNALHQKEDFSLLYPKGFFFHSEQEQLLGLFQHKIPAVRNAIYSLEYCLLAVMSTSNLQKNLTQYRNLLRLVAQNLMVEFNYHHVDNLLKLHGSLINRLWDFDSDYCFEMLRYLLVNSGIYEFKPATEKFMHFSKSSFSPYDFVPSSSDPTLLLPQQYERTLKTSISFVQILNLKPIIVSSSAILLKKLKAPKLKELFDSEIDSNHMSLLSYIFVLVQIYIENKVSPPSSLTIRTLNSSNPSTTKTSSRPS
jgi:hypothetical protein